MKVIDKDTVKSIMPKRSADANKYSVGSLLCVVGSRGFAGAAVMALRAAYRTGAGLVRCALPESIYPIVSAAVPEAVFVVFPDSQSGTLPENAARDILGLTKKCDAVLAGCGMGLCPDTESIVCSLLEYCEVPLVLDADGINAAAKHIDVLNKREFPTVLTPHEGEMHRLTGVPSKIIRENRTEYTEKFTESAISVLVLKGKDTLVAADGNCCVNPTGNPGMAVAGSGDVLAGMLAALIAQGAKPFEAAEAAVYLHGLAGDIAKDELTEYSLLPTDIIERIPFAIKKVLDI